MKVFYLDYSNEKGNITKLYDENIVTINSMYKGTPEEELIIKSLMEAFDENI